jgi:hypothetical protein
VVRARRNIDDGEPEFLAPDVSSDGVHLFDRSLLPGDEFWIQAGIATATTSPPIYEPWRRATAR